MESGRKNEGFILIFSCSLNYQMSLDETGRIFQMINASVIKVDIINNALIPLFFALDSLDALILLAFTSNTVIGRKKLVLSDLDFVLLRNLL